MWHPAFQPLIVSLLPLYRPLVLVMVKHIHRAAKARVSTWDCYFRFGKIAKLCRQATSTFGFVDYFVDST